MWSRSPATRSPADPDREGFGISEPTLHNLEQLFDGDIGALSSDESGQKWIVSFIHDRDPSVTYYYHHATGSSRRLFRP